MNLQLDLKILGWLLVGLGAVQAAPLLAALAVGEPLLPFVASATVAVVFGLSLALMAQPEGRNLRLRDGFVVVSFSWILASLFGALPYLLTDVLTPLDALFESVAGFTTTGSTVMEQIEAAPRSLLLWRSLTQWLGGMGIIVFAIAILPMLGIGGMQLFQAEMPGPAVEKLRPRVVETARRLLLVYLGFTAAAGLAYALAGMDAFEALCHALTTLSTGGFSTRSASIEGFGSGAIEWVAILFMVLGGINFALHYRLFQGQFRRVLGDTELGYFVSVLCVATFVIVWLLRGMGFEGEEALRKAAFQVVTLMTGTGYVSADFELWPPLATVVLLQLMILGGMAGSTSGGVKGLRVLLAAGVVRNTLARMLHPRLVLRVKYGDRPVPLDVLTGIWSFLTVYFAIAALAAAVVSSAGYDLVTSVSAALTAVGNVGPGFAQVGPTDTFAHFPGYVKLTLAACMMGGRLELFTLLVLFQPRFWQR
ncbi:MAG: TrkH family potassium uptake protein [Myxococcota bacterium]